MAGNHELGNGVETETPIELPLTNLEDAEQFLEQTSQRIEKLVVHQYSDACSQAVYGQKWARCLLKSPQADDGAQSVIMMRANGISMTAFNSAWWRPGHVCAQDGAMSGIGVLTDLLRSDFRSEQFFWHQQENYETEENYQNLQLYKDDEIMNLDSLTREVEQIINSMIAATIGRIDDVEADESDEYHIEAISTLRNLQEGWKSDLENKTSEIINNVLARYRPNDLEEMYNKPPIWLEQNALRQSALAVIERFAGGLGEMVTQNLFASWRRIQDQYNKWWEF
ncbi:hypothetical protein FWH58_00010 [Candidatus Saccharibacteria bacterium]|nr:hypothetical protein [Candidatus Saccharibacteria bacterium]